MRIVGLSHRRRRTLGTLVGVAALAALVVPSAGASGPALSPAILDVTGWTMATQAPAAPLLGAPLPAAGDGIGPGSYLLIHRSDGDFICTANFVWRDAAGNRYLGAAGHCFLPPADDVLVKQPAVRVCVSGCFAGGQLGTVVGGTMVDLGTVAYARQSLGGVDVGNDFGLVRIPAGMAVRPNMPVWGGPSGVPTAPSLGQPVCLYGNAAGLGEVFATKARAGVAGLGDARAWYASVPSAPGDSGAAVVNCPSLSGTTAAGILTHLATNGTGFIAGTTVARAKAMATEAGLSIDIVNP